MPAPVIAASGLIKRFGKVLALDELDLTIESGGVVALLGPNGAGKTTLVRTLATLLRPDGGTVSVHGHDVVAEARKVRSMIGLAGQHAAVEEAMTGRENLRMIASLYGFTSRAAKSRAGEVVDQLSLGEVADRLVRTYSGGQRRRLDLGASLVGMPRLLLLDEPTTGLDPRSRLELWEAVRELTRAGTDVLLTTQYLDEADQLAGRIVIVDRGRVIADGNPRDLKAQAGGQVVEIHLTSSSDLAIATRVLRDVARQEPEADPATRRLALRADAGVELLTRVAGALGDEGVAVEDIGLRQPTLDEVFVRLTGSATDPNKSTERTNA